MASQADQSADEIEVTPEMVVAGVSVLELYDVCGGEPVSERLLPTLATEVFEAMFAVSRETLGG